MSKEEMKDFYKDLIQDYPIKSIEDGFDEDDWEGWTVSASFREVIALSQISRKNNTTMC